MAAEGSCPALAADLVLKSRGFVNRLLKMVAASADAEAEFAADGGCAAVIAAATVAAVNDGEASAASATADFPRAVYFEGATQLTPCEQKKLRSSKDSIWPFSALR